MHYLHIHLHLCLPIVLDYHVVILVQIDLSSHHHRHSNQGNPRKINHALQGTRLHFLHSDCHHNHRRLCHAIVLHLEGMHHQFDFLLIQLRY